MLDAPEHLGVVKSPPILECGLPYCAWCKTKSHVDYLSHAPSQQSPGAGLVFPFLGEVRSACTPPLFVSGHDPLFLQRGQLRVTGGESLAAAKLHSFTFEQLLLEHFTSPQCSLKCRHRGCFVQQSVSPTQCVRLAELCHRTTPRPPSRRQHTLAALVHNFRDVNQVELL
jgi:hypothetical protein